MVTDRHTDTQNDYCNPAAHAQRVNNGVALSRHDEGHLWPSKMEIRRDKQHVPAIESVS